MTPSGAGGAILAAQWELSGDLLDPRENCRERGDDPTKAIPDTEGDRSRAAPEKHFQHCPRARGEPSPQGSCRRDRGTEQDSRDRDRPSSQSSSASSWGSQTLPVLAASLRPKHPSSSELWGHGARPGQPGVTRPGDTAEPTTTAAHGSLLCWGRCWGHLGALGRGPLEAAGIHGLVAVGSLGLLGDPLVDQVLGTAGDSRGEAAQG